jgi:hypothetical protein
VNGDARYCCPDACDQRCVRHTSWLPARWMGILKRKGRHHSPCCEATISIMCSTCTGMLEVFSLQTYLYQYIHGTHSHIFVEERLDVRQARAASKPPRPLILIVQNHRSSKAGGPVLN